MKNYTFSSKFIIRTPTNSFDELKSFYSYDIETLLCQLTIIDAIRIASLDLYENLLRYSRLKDKEKERVKNSLIRYINRMSTRCTPFGLFAGCSIGSIDDYTDINLSKKIIRHTRLDMDYLCTLSQFLSEIPDIKYKLKYFPNTSLYRVGSEYRYIEYFFFEGSRIHKISSVKRTTYLDKLLHFSRKGEMIDNLCSCLTDEFIQKDETVKYINELIKSQILISELDPTITGKDLLSRIISILDNINVDICYIEILKSIQELMMKIDIFNYNPITGYNQIEDLVNKIGAPYDRRFLLQVDINNVFLKCTIGKSIIKEISSTVKFLNKITPVYNDVNMSKFKEKFFNRYGDTEVSLLIALDPEIGIGYPVGSNNSDISPLLNNFIISKNDNTSVCTRYDNIQSVILRKIFECDNSTVEVELDDNDFIDAKENWDDLPDTFSVLFDIIKDNGTDTLIRLKSIGNSSAINLFARFSYTDKEFYQLAKDISQKEQCLNSDAILAEIVHLPDSRIGNVLYRPHLRNYEIVYLANSSMPKDRVIFASDILISIKSNKIVLRSKQLNREIIPYITNAHNYSSSSIPFYRFIGNLQSQNKRTSLVLDLPFLFEELSYIPRIRYKQTILSLATWNIRVSEVMHLFSIKEDDALLCSANIWREQKRIPIYTLLSDFDNELFIDWKNIVSLRSFLAVVKKRDNFRLIEFVYKDNEFVVKGDNGFDYMNECIVTLIKEM